LMQRPQGPGQYVGQNYFLANTIYWVGPTA